MKNSLFLFNKELLFLIIFYTIINKANSFIDFTYPNKTSVYIYLTEIFLSFINLGLQFVIQILLILLKMLSFLKMMK